MDVRLPDGTVIKNVPDGTTKADLVAKLKSNGMQVPAEWIGDDKAARIKAQEDADRKAYNPTTGMGTIERTVAGYGSAVPRTIRGIRQYLPEGLGGLSPEQVAEANKTDKPLLDTTAGNVGNIIGNVAAFAPTVAVPGAATLRGATALGAVQGLLTPEADAADRMTNAGIGAVAGAGGVAAGRAVAGAWQGAKALVEPFTDAGRQKIAGRVIQRFAEDPAKIAAAQGAKTITGALPTIAEETGDAGMARLQDALRSVDPQIANRIGQRLGDNNAARVGSLQTLAGDTSTRAAAEAARKTASADLYQQATKAAYTVDDKLSELLNRPAVKQALNRAKLLAENQGRKVDFEVNPSNAFRGMGVPDNSSRQITGQSLQDLKMAMDEMLTDPASGFTGKAGSTIKNLRADLINWMEDANPAFKAARTTYRDASKPLNAMDIGEEINRRATSNTSDLAGNQRMQANALLGMMRDEAGLIEKATGRKGVGNSLADVLSPDQLALLRAVTSETDRAAAVASAGAGPGSPTAQRLASQNILHQMIGPTGLPSSWAESALANTVIGKPFNLIYGGVAEPRIQNILADAVLDPMTARNAVAAAQQQGIKLPSNALTKLLAQSARVTPAQVMTGER